MQINICEADLTYSVHQTAVLEMVDGYARDPMGDGKPLSESVRQRLIPELQKHKTTLIFLAFDSDKSVGIAVCFVGFSTFLAQPLINIHDLAVIPEYRGKGIGKQLLSAVENKAKEMHCCKLTLEVLENNTRALNAYTSFGFSQAAYTEQAGGALFFSKKIED